jgi:hypothetical protein
MSSTKAVIAPYRVSDNVSMATSFISKESDVTNIYSLVYIIEWTGTSPVGDIVVEALTQSKLTTADNLDEWTPVSFGTTIPVSGNIGSHTIQFNEVPFTKLRVKYEATSGTGDMTITISGKGW